MKKFQKTEKMIIALVGNDYTSFRCEDHGVFQIHNSNNSGVCPYCKKMYKPLENITELKAKFKAELGL